jgi:chromosome segregation ATPase
VEDRISELKDKIEIKEETEEILDKQLNSWERNMQGLSDSIKRPNLRIMGTEEEEVQATQYIQKNNNRKLSKSQSFSQSGTGCLQVTKQT